MQPDPQDSFDCYDAYKEYGIYTKHQRASVIDNPLLSDPRSMIDPRYYKVNCLNTAEIQPQPISDASRRRIQFQQRWWIILYQYYALLRKCHNLIITTRHQSMRDPAVIGKMDTVGREQRDIQASRTYERRGSYNACLNCEMIRYSRDNVT